MTIPVLLLLAAWAQAAKAPRLSTAAPGAYDAAGKPLIDDVSLSSSPRVGVSPLAPRPPVPVKVVVTSGSDLARDLAARMDFLERGQAYFQAFTTGGSHTPAENKDFVRFLEDYERELASAKQELAVLNTWFEKKSALKSR